MMSFKDQFLATDVDKAIELRHQAINCLNESLRACGRGDVDNAQMHASQSLHLINYLISMSRNKNTMDKLVTDLKSDGVDAEKIESIRRNYF